MQSHNNEYYSLYTYPLANTNIPDDNLLLSSVFSSIYPITTVSNNSLNSTEKPKKLDIIPRQFEKSDSEKECSICQSHFSEREKISELLCKHCYHYSCIKEWVKIKPACPLCRKNIPPLER
jgi:hypothetical protein